MDSIRCVAECRSPIQNNRWSNWRRCFREPSSCRSPSNNRQNRYIPASLRYPLRSSRSPAFDESESPPISIRRRCVSAHFPRYRPAWSPNTFLESLSSQPTDGNSQCGAANYTPSDHVPTTTTSNRIHASLHTQTPLQRNWERYSKSAYRRAPSRSRSHHARDRWNTSSSPQASAFLSWRAWFAAGLCSTIARTTRLNTRTSWSQPKRRTSSPAGSLEDSSEASSTDQRAAPDVPGYRSFPAGFRFPRLQPSLIESSCCL